MKLYSLMASLVIVTLAACDQTSTKQSGSEGSTMPEPSAVATVAENPVAQVPSCESATSCTTARSRPYMPEEVSGLRIKEANYAEAGLRVVLSNIGSIDILPQATDGSSIKVTWGYAETDAPHPGYFSTRYEWVEALRPGQELELSIPAEVPAPVNGETLWVTLIQENVFWLHDKGVPAVKVDMAVPQ